VHLSILISALISSSDIDGPEAASDQQQGMTDQGDRRRGTVRRANTGHSAATGRQAHGSTPEETGSEWLQGVQEGQYTTSGEGWGALRIQLQPVRAV
jgi:hypothetical protein